MRKELKRAGLKNLRRHYLLFVAACLTMSILGSAYVGSLNAVRLRVSGKRNGSATSSRLFPGDRGLSDVLSDIFHDQLEKGGELAMERQRQEESRYEGSALSRSRGVLAQVVNGLTSGSFLVRTAEMIRSAVHSGRAMVLILILAGFTLFFFWWALVQNVIQVIAARLMLEGRVYAEVSPQRFLFLRDVHRWIAAACTMALTWLYRMLWRLTIVGGFIKRYSYFLVPYLVAENPDLSPRQAISLSRRMMDGHKWECFCLELSFFGWLVAGVLTGGVTEMLFSNPYRSSVLCEYYVRLRQCAMDSRIPGCEALNDRWLYEKADAEALEAAYPRTLAPETAPPRHRGLRWFFTDVLGVASTGNPEERAWQARQEAQLLAARTRAAREGLGYPRRLSPLADQERERRHSPDSIHYLRHYSVLSLTAMFFLFSVVGWLWEVSLHLVADGVFVKRGAMMGPWLPIYGSGAVLILLLLNRLRARPALEFAAAIALCGCVEYGTSYFMELAYGGTRWWDYTGYLLNLNGRICAEGLLVFGLGGMAVVYLLAPGIDSALRRVPRKILLPVCLALVVVFTADLGYSALHPNTGKGITTARALASSASVCQVDAARMSCRATEPFDFFAGVSINLQHAALTRFKA